MLGKMIAKIRKDKGMAKVELAKKTEINVGHLTHIEKEERHPSHKALKAICEAMQVPYQNLMHMYDRNISENQERYKVFDHISYNKVVAVDKIDNFIDCPYSIPNASLAFKMQDDSMEPKIGKGDYLYLDLNAPLESRDFGLILYDGKYYVRRFIVRLDKLILRPENKSYPEIDLSEDDDFTIIGKVFTK